VIDVKRPQHTPPFRVHLVDSCQTGQGESLCVELNGFHFFEGIGLHEIDRIEQWILIVIHLLAEEERARLRQVIGFVELSHIVSEDEAV